MLKKFRTKSGLLILLGLAFTLVLGLSYATFIFTTGNYRSTELLIGKLNYGISIKEDGTTSTVSGSNITVPKNTKAYFVVTITSINSVDSKYVLAYKASNTSVTVNYTDRTSWNSTGFIKGYDDNTYSKKVRIVVNNPTTGSKRVNLAVYGGYSFNTIEAINVGNGYKVIPGGYTETDSLQIFDLTTLIEKENDCTATETTPCLYGGENERNYVQYPETTNKSENIWRILGTYSIESSSLPKLISTKTSTSTTSSLTTDLTTFYNNLTDTDTFVYGTNKFNCTSSGCTSNTYTNIGLLTEYEYNLIGGLNSYLSSLNPFFIQGSSSVLEATSSEIKTSTSSNLRPVIYLKNNVQVQGSGTASDPYILVPTSDINIVAYTLNGQTTTKKYEELLKYNLVNKITCENGSIAEWDNETASIKLTSVKAPDYCTIDFKDGFTVSLSAGTTGTVKAPVSQSIGYNGTVSFTVTSNTGSTELTKNTCNGVLSGSTFTISNVTSNKSCEIEFYKETTLAETIKSYASTNTNGIYNEDGYRYEGSDPSNYIYMPSISTNEKELWRIIGVFNDGENGEEVIRVRRHYEKNSYPTMAYDTNATNHFPNTTMYTALSATYNSANYPYTVNYKIYLGSSSNDVAQYVSAQWYSSERGSEAGATAQANYGGATSFVGSVGLMYPSDYGYAVQESDCSRRIILSAYNTCSTNNWLYQGENQVQWLITPSFDNAVAGYIVTQDGSVSQSGDTIYYDFAYSPVMALPSTTVVKGSGTLSDPYVIV